MASCWSGRIHKGSNSESETRPHLCAERGTNCVMGDDWEWHEAGPLGAATALPNDFCSLYGSLLHTATRGHMFPEQQPRQRRSGAQLLLDCSLQMMPK